MDNSKIKLLKYFFSNLESLEYFCSLKSVDEMYFYVKSISFDITYKEFIEFLLINVKIYEILTNMYRLPDFDTEYVSGGKINLKLAINILPLMILPFNSDIPASNNNSKLDFER